MKIKNKLITLLCAYLCSSVYGQLIYIPDPDIEGLPLAHFHVNDTNVQSVIPIHDASAISLDAFTVVNPQPASARASKKDNASIERRLGYSTTDEETVNFAGFIDTSNLSEDIQMYVIVDDKCKITISPQGGVTQSVSIHHGALWSRNGEPERIDYNFEPGNVYRIQVEYTNETAVNYPAGIMDVDGISVYFAMGSEECGVLDVTAAPNYIFSNAQHIAPIFFKIEDLEDNVEVFIRSARVRFVSPGGTLEQSISLFSAGENRNVFRAGVGENGNGEGIEFVAYIDSVNFFRGANLPSVYNGAVLDNSLFTIDIFYSKVIDGEIEEFVRGLSSDPADAESAVQIFADERYTAYDMPSDGENRNEVSGTWNNGDYEDELYEHDTVAVTYKPDRDVNQNLVIDHTGVGAAFTPFHLGESKATVTRVVDGGLAVGDEIEAKLLDFSRFTGSTQSQHSRIGVINYVRGNRFYISYRGQEIEGLSRPRMNLNEDSVRFEATPYDGLTSTFSGETIGDDSVANALTVAGVIGDGLSLAGAILPATGVGAPIALVASITGPSISLIASAVGTSGQGDTTGQGHLTPVLVKQSPGGIVEYINNQNAGNRIIFNPALPNPPARPQIVMYSIAVRPGDHYQTILNAEVHAEVQGALVSTIGYRLKLKMEASSSEDWATGKYQAFP